MHMHSLSMCIDLGLSVSMYVLWEIPLRERVRHWCERHLVPNANTVTCDALLPFCFFNVHRMIIQKMKGHEFRSNMFSA